MASATSTEAPTSPATAASAGAARRALARLHLAAGALLVGLARASLEHASAYVQERIAFGKPLAQHQGVAFIVADMAVAADAARLLLRRAALAFDQGDSRCSAPAYLECVEAALGITDAGVQLLGGHGYMKAHPVEKWMRDARALALLFGGTDLAELVSAEIARAAIAGAERAAGAPHTAAEGTWT